VLALQLAQLALQPVPLVLQLGQLALQPVPLVLQQAPLVLQEAQPALQLVLQLVVLAQHEPLHQRRENEELRHRQQLLTLQQLRRRRLWMCFRQPNSPK